jgi:hypothetical protein
VVCASVALVLVAIDRRARADVFVLKNDGHVRGELVNRDQTPRTTYEVRTPGGGLVTLEADQVKQQVRQSANEMEYDRLRLVAPDTVEGQWSLAEWCREHNLSKQRKPHLERILELDPDHKPAHLGLKHEFLHGRWTTRDEAMQKQGYVKDKAGVWRLPQEIGLADAKKKDELAQKEWFLKIKRWREWLDTGKADLARENIEAIDDPYATKALSHYLGDETERDPKLLFVDALARINTPISLSTLAWAALNDTDEEVRMFCLDRIVRKGYKASTGMFVQALKHKDNEIVNRAGVALGQMKDPATIGPLIDAVVTVHKRVIIRGQPGQMTTTFGSGPNGGQLSGFSFGAPPPEVVTEQFNNPSVLNALVGLTNVNFEYDTHAWKYWLAAQKKPTTLDARRD